MIYLLNDMMVDVIDNWDNSIFYYGGDTSLVGYTEKEYALLGYKDKRDFLSDEFFVEFDSSNRVQGNNAGIGHTYNNDDKDTLAEYAHYLFSNIKEKKTIYRYMLKLALYVNRYRYLKTREEIINDLMGIGKKKPKKHYTKEEKEKQLKRYAERMIILMGGEMDTYSKVGNILKEIANNPHLYLLENKFETATSIESIETFLLKIIPDKKDEIGNFIEDIAKIK